jgi:acetyltransferase-like isoleucine patch superfamily enzyme
MKKYKKIIDKSATKIEIFNIYSMYFMRLLRFIFSKSFSIKSFPSFFGNNVNIRNSRKFQFGYGLNVGDNVTLECFVKQYIEFGNNCTLKNNVQIIGMGVMSEFGEYLKVGHEVGISDNVLIYVRGPIRIGDKTIIGPGAKFISENHNTLDINIPIKEQGVTRKGISIGQNVWIGANAIILDGVSIGDGAVIAAGSVVNKSISSNVVAGGVPVKILKERKVE